MPAAFAVAYMYTSWRVCRSNIVANYILYKALRTPAYRRHSVVTIATNRCVNPNPKPILPKFLSAVYCISRLFHLFSNVNAVMIN